MPVTWSAQPVGRPSAPIGDAADPVGEGLDHEERAAVVRQRHAVGEAHRPPTTRARLRRSRGRSARPRARRIGAEAVGDVEAAARGVDDRIVRDADARGGEALEARRWRASAARPRRCAGRRRRDGRRASKARPRVKPPVEATRGGGAARRGRCARCRLRRCRTRSRRPGRPRRPRGDAAAADENWPSKKTRAALSGRIIPRASRCGTRGRDPQTLAGRGGEKMQARRVELQADDVADAGRAVLVRLHRHEISAEPDGDQRAVAELLGGEDLGAEVAGTRARRRRMSSGPLSERGGAGGEPGGGGARSAGRRSGRRRPRP